MAMRAATMSPTDTSPFAREPNNLFPKLVLLFLLITAAVLGIVLMFQQVTNFPVLLSTFFADASLGLIAGFGSRVLLQNRNWFIRFLVAFLVVIVGMIVLGSLTGWILGIGPIELERKVADQIRQISLDRNVLEQFRSMKINPRKLFDFSKMEWSDLAHLSISTILTVMALQAWSPTPIQPVEVTPLPAPPTSARSNRSTRARRRKKTSSASSNGGSRIQPPGGWLGRLGPVPQPGPRTRSNNGSRSTVLNEAKKGKDQVVRPKRRRLHRKPHIQFALVEEHRCPYCLDSVTRNDPRGVKECEVCHTLHHADCWAITGTCQVPHLNT